MEATEEHVIGEQKQKRIDSLKEKLNIPKDKNTHYLICVSYSGEAEESAGSATYDFVHAKSTYDTYKAALRAIREEDETGRESELKGGAVYEINTLTGKEVAEFIEDEDYGIEIVNIKKIIEGEHQEVVRLEVQDKPIDFIEQYRYYIKAMTLGVAPMISRSGAVMDDIEGSSAIITEFNNHLWCSLKHDIIHVKASRIWSNHYALICNRLIVWDPEVLTWMSEKYPGSGFAFVIYAECVEVVEPITSADACNCILECALKNYTNRFQNEWSMKDDTVDWTSNIQATFKLTSDQMDKITDIREKYLSKIICNINGPIGRLGVQAPEIFFSVINFKLTLLEYWMLNKVLDTKVAKMVDDIKFLDSKLEKNCFGTDKLNLLTTDTARKVIAEYLDLMTRVGEAVGYEENWHGYSGGA